MGDFLAPGQMEPPTPRLTNADFRKLMATPRHPGSGSSAQTPAHGSASQTPGGGAMGAGKVPATPRARDKGKADKRREKRRRNLTQAISLSSLGAEFDEGLSQKSSFHSPVSTPESDKLHSVKGGEIDNQSFWEPRTYGESQQAPQKETLNDSIRGSSDATWNTPGHVEEIRSFPDSPSTLPPPPSFLLNPGQSYHGRNPDQYYGIFEP